MSNNYFFTQTASASEEAPAPTHPAWSSPVWSSNETDNRPTVDALLSLLLVCRARRYSPPAWSWHVWSVLKRAE